MYDDLSEADIQKMKEEIDELHIRKKSSGGDN